MRRSFIPGLGSVAALLVLFATQPGCNKVPVKAIQGEYTVQNEIRDTRPDIPKIDIVFVIDNSHSMCEEQINIGKNFDKFIKDFKDTIKADFRIGVVTTDASDPNKGGKFREELGSFTSCSVNVDTSECKNFKLAGGIITSTDASLDLEKAFRCISTVGTVQGGLAQIEQGLKAARYALDKNGPLPSQAQNFLRDDAFLAIILVSDEDDCSWKEGVTWTDQNFSRCALMPEKLVPVGDYVNFFKRLKPTDPGKVMVAVISGDAVVPGLDANDPGFNVNPQVISQREDFLTDKAAGAQDTYICESDNGRADFGRRYRELVEKFGSNGVFANICQNDFGPALALISKRIIDNIY
ncbi:MAG: VWA domain-containing protein, partial [Myxococcales bacterium]|nr:VWA domain-containing protein [Myxococcales bacterium]